MRWFLPLQVALSSFLKRELGSNAPSEPLEISQFSHGQSNPTYFIKVGGRRGVAGLRGPAWARAPRAAPAQPLQHPGLPFLQAGDKSMVLRKQPPGKVLQSAHAVDREFRVMSAMASAGVPVPRTVAMCADPGVLGTPFYIMEFVKGQIFVDPGMADATPDRRAVAYKV